MSEEIAALMTAGNASDCAVTPYMQARDAVTAADSPGSRPARVVVEAECGILVYPPEAAGEPWRAVFTENGRRRFRQAMTEAELAAKLAKVTERLRAAAPDMERPGADLIAHYLDPDRLPVGKRWSRRHADTQRRLCRRFAAPVIAAVTCQDITAGHMQQIVNAAPTASEGDRLHRCLSALVSAGMKGGYLASPRLREVHWQAGDRPVPEPEVSTSGESALWVDPAEIPAGTDVARLGQALAPGRRGELEELMANVAAYAGLRQGELFALTAWQITAARAGHHRGPQAHRGRRAPVRRGAQVPQVPQAPSTPSAPRRDTRWPAKLADRVEQARAEQDAGTNPLGLMFPSPRFRHWRSSNFDRRVLAPAYRAAGWRDEHGNGDWTWHSLRHVFCTTALFTWELDATDVSRMAGHANYRITLDMYVGTTKGVLDRARQATQ